MPTKNIESRNEKMSPREQLDNQARKELFAAQKLKDIRYFDSNKDYVWLGAKKNWPTMEMTINKKATWKLHREGKVITALWEMLMWKIPTTEYTLRFGPKGYELITKDGKWERTRRLQNEGEIREVLRNFDRRLREVDKVKHERDAKARREANKLADAKTQKERDDADQNLASSLEDIA